tara:strand:- start:6507 stop:7043 length:537 start_codon:yes stop_codon:yes gene_type:complete
LKRFYNIYLISLVFFSCESNFNEIKQINKNYKIPVGITDNFILKYSDSANIKAVLESPKNYDYTNQLFPYSEFPDGLKIEFFDPNEGNTIVSSDYGIVYYETKIVSLEGNVKILSADGSSILSPQIYWDPDEEWLFTEENIVFSGKDYNIRASKLDADRSFKLLKTGQLNGNFLFEDN